VSHNEYGRGKRKRKAGAQARPGPNIHVAVPFNSDIEVEYSDLRFFTAVSGTLCMAAPGRGGIFRWCTKP
jgi:hypothetical protein